MKMMTRKKNETFASETYCKTMESILCKGKSKKKFCIMHQELDNNEDNIEKPEKEFSQDADPDGKQEEGSNSPSENSSGIGSDMDDEEFMAAYAEQMEI